MLKKEVKNLDLKKGMQMMKQLANRGEKTEVMTEELCDLEKKLEALKHVYVTSSKKIAGSVQSSTGESDDKRRKKIAEYALANTFRELSQTVPPDTATFAVLNKCSDVLLAVTDDFIRYQKAVEVVLSDLNTLVDVSISDLEKKKKDVKDLGSKMDAAKNRYNILLRQAHQTSQQVTSYSNPSVGGWNAQQTGDASTSLSGGLDGSISAAAFGEDVRDAQREASEAEEKMERYREDLKVSMRKFCKSEAEHSNMLVQLLSAQLELHRSCFERLEAAIPLCTRTIQELTPRPVFGIPLDEHLKQTGRRIAIVIEEGYQLLMKRGLEEEGLFRLAASQQKLKRLKNFYDFGRSLEQDRTFEEDVHVIAGAIKQYLRELPEPLLGFAQYDDWVRGVSYDDRERVNLYRNCVRKLPVSNRENLERLIQLLKQVVQHCDRNKMNEQNIGICIGPNVLWSESSRNGGESDAGIMIQVCPVIVGTLVQYYDRIFDQSAEQNRSTDDLVADSAQSQISTEMKRAGSLSGAQPPRVAPQRRPPPPPVKPTVAAIEADRDRNLSHTLPQPADSTSSALLIDFESTQTTSATVYQPVAPPTAVPAALHSAASRLARSASSASAFGSQTPSGPRLPVPARPLIEPPRQAPPPPPPPPSQSQPPQPQVQPPTPSYMYAYQQNTESEGVQQPPTLSDASNEYVNVSSLKSDASSIYSADVTADSTGSPSRQTRNPPAPPVRRPSQTQTHVRNPSSEPDAIVDRPPSPTQASVMVPTAGLVAKPEAPVKPAPPAPPARTYGAGAAPLRRN